MGQTANANIWDIEAFQNGSETIFKWVYDRYVGQLFYFARNMVHHTEIAEEIVSDSFFKLWQIRQTETFAKLENVKAFLYVVTRRACLDHLKLAHTRAQFQPLEEQSLMSEAEVLGLMIKTDFYNALHQALQKLSNMQAEVFKLSFFEGLSTAEISDALGISSSAVFAHKSLAIKKLRQMIHAKDWLVLVCILRIFECN